MCYWLNENEMKWIKSISTIFIFWHTLYKVLDLSFIQMVREEVKHEYVPSSLKSNVYTLMMMPSRIKEFFQSNHKTGNNEINLFMMLIPEMNSFHSEPSDASHPWLSEIFLENQGINSIHPKKNESFSLKDHRFYCIFKLSSVFIIFQYNEFT